MNVLSKEILERCRKEKIAVFGAGKKGRFIAEMAADMGCEVTLFIDNDIRKQGKLIGQADVVSVKKLAECSKGVWIFLSVNSPEVEQQLMDSGIVGDHIIDLSAYSLERKLPFFDEYSKTKLPKNKYLFLSEGDWLSPHTAISSLCVYEGFIWVRGWAIPSDFINRVTIKINGENEVSALPMEREDVMKAVPYHYTKKCGFYYFGKTEIKENITVEISFWSNNIFIKSIIKSCEYLSTYQILNDYFQNNNTEELVKIIKKNKNILLKEKENIAKVLRSNLENFIQVKDRIFVYQLLYHLDAFENTDMEKYLDLVEALDDIDGQAYLCEQEIPWIIFLHPELRVDKIYRWQRKMYNYIAKKMYIAKKEQKKRNEDRIVVLVDNLLTDIMASAILKTRIANEFQGREYQVLMVVADTSFSSDLNVPSCVTRHNNSRQYAEQHKKMRTVPWEIYYCKEEGFRKRKLEMFDVIEEFGPAMVIDISQAGMIVSAALFQHGFKIIHISLSGYSSGAVFHRYIAKSKELCHIENKTYHSIDEEKIIEAPILLLYNLESNKQYTRKECGIESSDFVMVTVGNRLQYEMDEKFLLKVKEILYLYSQIKWIVVGNNLGYQFYEYLQEYINNGQVIVWGFEDELPALYRLCDVYINPERMGGGGSIVMAMQLGIPVAMTKKTTDITPIIGKENCKKDYSDLAQYIIDLAESEYLRKNEGEKMKNIVGRRELTMEYYTEKVLMAYKDILEKGI